MDKKIYELGYLLVPSIAEENVASEVQAIKAVLEKYESEFITEDFPKLRALSYPMTKKANGSSAKFDKAYFGWVKFETNPNVIDQIKGELDKSDKILRSMIVLTVRENTLIGQKMIFRPHAEGEKEGKKEEKMSEEEIEKTIENLVVE